MGRLKWPAWCVAVASVSSIVVHSQSRSPSNAVLYEGARLIIGDGSATMEGGAFVVQNGRIGALGRKGAVAAACRRHAR